jgi:hypothetical protein
MLRAMARRSRSRDESSRARFSHRLNLNRLGYPSLLLGINSGYVIACPKTTVTNGTVLK